MSNRLGGKQGTAYLGTNANQPPNWSFEIRDPNQYDFNNYSLGDLWLNTVNFNVWVLVSLAGNANNTQLARWVKFEANALGSLVTLTGDTGGAVPGDTNNNINLLGTANQITTTGNSATSSITFALANTFFQTGSWTPVLSFGGVTTGITYSVQKGEYTLLGNVVFATANITLTSKGAAVGNAAIDGLIIPVGSTLDSADGILHVAISLVSDAGFNVMWSNFVKGTTRIDLFEGTTTTAALQQITNANFGNDSKFTIQGFYYTD